MEQGTTVSLSLYAYSEAQANRIVQQAREKGGVKRRSPVPWVVAIYFEDARVGQQFYENLPRGDKEG